MWVELLVVVKNEVNTFDLRDYVEKNPLGGGGMKCAWRRKGHSLKTCNVLEIKNGFQVGPK